MNSSILYSWESKVQLDRRINLIDELKYSNINMGFKFKLVACLMS